MLRRRSRHSFFTNQLGTLCIPHNLTSPLLTFLLDSHTNSYTTIIIIIRHIPVGASAATFVLAGGPLSIPACGMTAVAAPYAAYQKRQLNELGGFRGQANELREHVNELHRQNDILTGNIDRLEGNVSGLEDVESKLNDFAKGANTNAERLQYVILETARLQTLIKKNLRKKVLQDVLSIVIKADRNRDYTLNRVEIEMLIFRLNTLPSVDFQEDNFRKLLKGKKMLTVTEVMDILRNLLAEDIPEEEAIFRIKIGIE